MEEAGLRRPDFTVLQDFETRSHWAPVETELRFHFYSHHGGVGDENFPACFGTDHKWASALSRPAGRSHSLLAGGGHFYRDLCQRDQHHHLCQQEVVWGNNRVRCTSVALADLIQ